MTKLIRSSVCESFRIWTPPILSGNGSNPGDARFSSPELKLVSIHRSAVLPKVSVVLPVFNAEGTVARAVRSILEQSLTSLELLVVDDGSTDSSADIVRQIEDPRLKLISTSHVGVANAANFGAAQAQAEFIARMDADDVSHPQRLERQLRWLSSEDLDVVGCRVRIVDSGGRPTETLQRYENWINEETISSEQIHALRFVELAVVNPTVLARREYFEFGFRDDDLPEDYDLMLRAAAAGMRFGKVDACLFDWYDMDGRLTRNDARYSVDAFMRCRRSWLLEGPLAGHHEVDVWGAGKTGKPWLLWLQSVGRKVRRVYDVHPRKIGKLIHNVPVVDPNQMPHPDGRPLIVAVGAAGARSLIWNHVVERGYVPGADTWFVA